MDWNAVDVPDKGAWLFRMWGAAKNDVWIAGNNGVLHALDTTNGKTLWEFATSQDYETVNKVAGANGGAISSVGPIFAGGMM